MPQQSQPQQAPDARQVVEFIMSMYDQQQGTFPKGEEGVKIAVEKRFGDQAGQFASQVVERLSTKEQAQPNFSTMQSAIQEAADAATVGELEAAIKKFQTAAGITADGKMGPQTQKAMQAAKAQTAAPAQGSAPAPGGAPAAAPAPATTTAPPAAPATTAPTQGGTTNTTTKTNVSGTIKMGKPDGPIQFNGKTVQPGQPEYAAASQALLAQQQRMQQARQRPGAASTSSAPVQQGASQTQDRDF
jgi:hypothetical protein